MKKLLLLILALAAAAMALRAGADGAGWLADTAEHREWLYALLLAVGIRFLLGHHLD
ncbi:MAG: hypothetical protein HYV16_09700 [Gammaproteobacteria bacterium]|nr:hypothetical protein [Gammaproteobacteria bacterium]